MAWWKYGQYLKMVYTLYRVVLGIWGTGILSSMAYGFAGRRGGGWLR